MWEQTAISLKLRVLKTSFEAPPPFSLFLLLPPSDLRVSCKELSTERAMDRKKPWTAEQAYPRPTSPGLAGRPGVTGSTPPV